MNDDNLARARAWIEHAIDLMPSGEESVVQACAIALAAAVRAKGLEATDAQITTWLVGREPFDNGETPLNDYGKRVLRVALASIRAHAADVPPPPVTP